MDTTTAMIRSRIHLDSTIKDGWRYESSAELIAPVTMPAAEREGILLAELARSRDLGERERDERNRRDRKTDPA